MSGLSRLGLLPASLAAAFISVALLVAQPAPARAEHVTFGEPQATTVLGQPLVFSTSLQASGGQPEVELLLSVPSERAVTVLSAEVTEDAGGWQAVATLEGHTPPNTPLHYQFRVRHEEGTTLGPAADALVTDTGHEWRTIEGSIVRLHWYTGDDAFAQRALEIGEQAIANASELLGVTETEPIDFFIYDSQEAMQTALGPGTPEYSAGQAHGDIRTMFGAIAAFEINSDWVDTLVTHELTHLVFETATANPYHQPPRWLNEGVAVYLSEGNTDYWQSVVDDELSRDDLIPLSGLGGLFPTTHEQSLLAYGESVSAIDYFVQTYDEQTLWDLVRSYAQGTSDDDAFRTATGGDLAAFNAAWMASLGADVPEPFGPQPGPPGPLPVGWDTVLPPSPSVPVGTGAPVGTAAPVPTAADGFPPASGRGTPQASAGPTPSVGETNGDESRPLMLAALSIAAILLAVLLGVLIVGRRRRARRPPLL